MSQRTKPPFRADQVGSLLRPESLKQAFRSHALGQLDLPGLKAAQDAAIRAVLGTPTKERIDPQAVAAIDGIQAWKIGLPDRFPDCYGKLENVRADMGLDASDRKSVV